MVVNCEGANTEDAVDSSAGKARINSGTESSIENADGNSDPEEGNSGTEKMGVPLVGRGEAAKAPEAPPALEAPEGQAAAEAILPMVEAPPTMPAPKSPTELSPLDYLLGVMNDPQAPPGLRIQAARVTAPYVHARVGPAEPIEAAIEDPYGFTFDLAAAKALREDVIALQTVPSGSKDERRAIETRLFERQMTLPDPPARYKREDYEWEQGRLGELDEIRREKGPGSEDARKIDAEAVILTGRVKAFEASLARPRLSRLTELTNKMGKVGLMLEEHRELRRLFDHFPHLERPQFRRPIDLVDVDRSNDPLWNAALTYRRPPDPRYPQKDSLNSEDVRNRLNPYDADFGEHDGDPYWEAAKIYRKNIALSDRKESKR